MSTNFDKWKSTMSLGYAMSMKQNRQMYNIIELHSGMKGICRYDRIGALIVAHKLNKKYPNERYAICAV